MTARWPVPDCALPRCIDVDAATRRVFASCREGHPYALDARDRRVFQSLPIGRGGDVVTVDADARRVMTANADGTLSVFAIGAGGTLKASPDVPTMVGARTIGAGA